MNREQLPEPVAPTCRAEQRQGGKGRARRGTGGLHGDPLGEPVATSSVGGITSSGCSSVCPNPRKARSITDYSNSLRCRGIGQASWPVPRFAISIQSYFVQRTIWATVPAILVPFVQAMRR